MVLAVPIVTVAMLCLALNLILTGVFIVIVKKLVGVGTSAPVTSSALQDPQPSQA